MSAWATVVRDGDEVHLDPDNLVLGDVLLLRSGDQAVIDGVVVGKETAQVDESLLTGEADAVGKANDDPVYAGSFCVSGTLRFQATRKSAHSVASGIVADARSLRLSLTPLQKSVNAIIRLLLAIAFSMLGLLLLSSVIWEFPSVLRAGDRTVLMFGCGSAAGLSKRKRADLHIRRPARSRWGASLSPGISRR
jgi:cation-transporting ATPase E